MKGADLLPTGKNVEGGEDISQKTNYDECSKSELIRHLKSKEKIIESLKESFRVQSKMDKDQVAKYRAKLEEEILHSEKTVKQFENVTEKVVEIIKKYCMLDQKTREAVNNMILEIRETHSKGLSIQQNGDLEDDALSDISDISEFSCFDEIVSETSKFLSYLSKLTDESLQGYLQLKKNLPTPNKLSNLEPNEEIQNLKLEINNLMLQNKNLTSLLEQSEAEKKKILSSICSILHDSMLEKLLKLSTSELIEHIKRMTYRIKQLERDKEEIYLKSKSDKEQNHKKFNQLLKEVKEVGQSKKHVINHFI